MMKRSIVRLTQIEIEQFKNVARGKVNLVNTRKKYAASILGLYGQNGSGKTALIEALALLKYILMGLPVPQKFADSIAVDASHAAFCFTFAVRCGGEGGPYEYEAQYRFSIRKDADGQRANMERHVPYKVTVYDETLSASVKSPAGKAKMAPVIDTRTEKAFAPKTKFDILIGPEKKKENELVIAKKIAEATSRSFVFSRELAEAVKGHGMTSPYALLYKALMNYGNFELFIIDMATGGLIAIDALPLSFSFEREGKRSAGSLMITLNGVSRIPAQALDVVKKVVSSMNIVLAELVPGLTIDVKEVGAQLEENGMETKSIQFISLKNSKIIPLKQESEGIKKIISVLNLLIGVYNRPSFTVAIDELDSGIFEYLLGELLRIISEKGKGQLLFTSHNLRPLETLDRGFIAFTTTNPNNRYIRLINVKTSHNVRDFYYRDIVLGEQNEQVYEPTNNYDIALAFREAGDMIGT